jgi:3-deoxy-7-phosphoheptulonate synthase
MLIVMSQTATPEDMRRVVEMIEGQGFKANPIPGAMRTAIGITGNRGPLDPRVFEALPGVQEAIPVSKPFKLVSREWKAEDTVVEVGPAKIGGGHLAIMAGPCGVESMDQALTIARRVKEAGANIYRGGAFKPRTSPYSFQGLGVDGLKILAKVREETGLPIVTEAIDAQNVDLVEEYADMIQIGARNMQAYTLLKRAGRSRLPVLLKRGMSATLDELLLAAEYIMNEGNPNVVLCERGVRTFADHSRNTLDLSAIPAVKSMSHLPIIADPSHGTGKREKVAPMARAAIAAGADGLMVEVHNAPEKALSDGFQALYPDQFDIMMGTVRRLSELLKTIE